MRHAQTAGDTGRMVRMIRQHTEAMFGRSEFNTVLRWMRAILFAQLAMQPGVCVGYAWVSLVTGHPDECERCLLAIEREAEASSSSSALIEVMVLRATVAMMPYDIPRVLELCQRVLPQLSGDRPLVYNRTSDLRVVVVQPRARARIQGAVVRGAGCLRRRAKLAAPGH